MKERKLARFVVLASAVEFGLVCHSSHDVNK